MSGVRSSCETVATNSSRSRISSSARAALSRSMRPDAPLHLELPDEDTDEEGGGQSGDDQREPRVGVRHAGRTSQAADLGVDARLETGELACDLRVAERQGPGRDSSSPGRRRVSIRARTRHRRAGCGCPRPGRSFESAGTQTEPRRPPRRARVASSALTPCSACARDRKSWSRNAAPPSRCVRKVCRSRSAAWWR